MFTGIIRAFGKVVGLHLRDGGAFADLVVAAPETVWSGLEVGASVAVDGVCLTAEAIQDGRIRFSLIAETLACTTLGSRREGDQVHLERSMGLGDEVGGHLLSGHIMARGEIMGREEVGENLSLRIAIPDLCRPYFFAKGYIAVDGVSLTVAKLHPNREDFTVQLIPETRRLTNLGVKTVGEPVNLEIDSHTQAAVDTTLRTLREYGLIPQGKGA